MPILDLKYMLRIACGICFKIVEFMLNIEAPIVDSTRTARCLWFQTVLQCEKFFIAQLTYLLSSCRKAGSLAGNASWLQESQLFQLLHLRPHLSECSNLAPLPGCNTFRRCGPLDPRTSERVRT